MGLPVTWCCTWQEVTLLLENNEVKFHLLHLLLLHVSLREEQKCNFILFIFCLMRKFVLVPVWMAVLWTKKG